MKARMLDRLTTGIVWFAILSIANVVGLFLADIFNH